MPSFKSPARYSAPSMAMPMQYQPVMTSQSAQVFQGMPQTAKIIIVSVVSAGVLFTAYKLYGYFSNLAASQSGKKEVSDVNSQLTTLQNQGISPSYPDAQYDTWANELKPALSGCGTNSTVMNGVITKLNNDADVYKLVTAFGVPTLDGCVYGTSVGSLAAALANKGQTNNVNNILKLHGITYRF